MRPHKSSRHPDGDTTRDQAQPRCCRARDSGWRGRAPASHPKTGHSEPGSWASGAHREQCKHGLCQQHIAGEAPAQVKGQLPVSARVAGWGFLQTGWSASAGGAEMGGCPGAWLPGMR